MATDLASIKTRLGVMLFDAAGTNYPAAQLEESIRLALGEYNLMMGIQGETAVTLKDLDGAAATTIPAGHESLLVNGAAGFAVTGRAIDRSEAFDLNQELPQQLVDLSKRLLGDFRKMVSQVRADLTRDENTAAKSALHGSAAPPYPSTSPITTSWPVDGRDGETL